MGAKKQDAAKSEVRPDDVKPKSPFGRAAIKGSPVKSWSGGMTPDEASHWEQVAENARNGVAPRFTLRALGLTAAYRKLRTQGHPAYLYILEAWNQGIAAILAEIRQETSWQAKMTLLERTEPMEFAVDGSIRRTIIEWAQEAGLEVATLNDVVRIVKRCQELEIDLGDLVEDEIKRREADLA